MEQIRYWAGGYGNKELSPKDQKARLQEFIKDEYWQADFTNSSTKTTRQKKLFADITIGDKFLIKGFGGKYQIKVYFVGEVVEKDEENYRLGLKKEYYNIYNRKLAVAQRAPGGIGAGSWFNTLLEVKRQDIIDTFFNKG